MKNNETTGIEGSILFLEAKKDKLLKDVKSEINILATQLKPSNLIKSAATGIMAPSNRLIVVKYIAGAVLGYLGRRYIFGGSAGIVRKITGKAVLWMVRKMIFKL